MILIDVQDEDGNTQFVNILHIQRIFVKMMAKEITTIISFSDATGDCWELAVTDRAMELAERINKQMS